jgi:predicted ABC-class ATPase
MRDKKEFYDILSDIGGQPADEYAQLVGDFDFSRYVLKINSLENVTGGGNLLVIRVPQTAAAFPPNLFSTPVRRTALEDFLTRKLASEIDKLTRYDESGVSRRRLNIAAPGQKMLPRTALLITDEYLEARIEVTLPILEGTVQGEAAKNVFFEDLPEVVSGGLLYCNMDEEEVCYFVDIMEDADRIRQMLPTLGYVSFMAEGAMFNRLGNLDIPDYEQAQALHVPDDLAVELDTPNSGPIRGFGIPQGITVILGDAYSGRTDFLRAIGHGIYNHVPGDGRELCLTVPDAVHVSAESGRSIQRVDLSFFLSNLPNGSNATRYSTSDSDPCAAQAAQTVEALEIGARVLLYDEADSSGAFLTRDSRLSGLMPDTELRITPLSARARQMVDELGVSLVIAGSSAVAEFIPEADQVYRINNNAITDITEQAKLLHVKPLPVNNLTDVASLLESSRWIVPSSIDPSSGKEDFYVQAIAPDLLEFGRSVIDLQSLNQIADIHQTETIGRILYYAKIHYLDEGRPIRELLDLVDRDLSTEGLECLSRDLRGDLARPRRYEIAAALNRLSTLRISRSLD